MSKYLLIAIFLFGGCSQFEFNVGMCDRDFTDQQSIPQECRNYKEAEAQKAFDKVKNDSKLSDEELLKVKKETK